MTPIKIYGEGKALEDLSFRKSPPKPSMKTRLMTWFWFKVYCFHTWLIQWHHKYNTNYHYWEWVEVAECGCCGFEGMVCKTCNAKVLIGEVGYSWDSKTQSRLESGDYSYYGY